MNFLERGYIKLYYHIANIILRKQEIDLPIDLGNSRNLFLYFDYEREFGGHSTNICDGDIINILDLLDRYQIKTTWFIVGKIFKKYPASVKEIIKRGHEIGSHTYSHIVPLNTPKYILKKDFFSFKKVSDTFANVIGFHAPNGKWSLSMLENFSRYGFLYDIIGLSKGKTVKTYQIKLGHCQKHLRIKALGDDWQMFKKKPTREQVLNHFISLSHKMNHGQLGGIGFHPWVLKSDNEIYMGFEMFLSYVSSQKDMRIEPAMYYAKKIQSSSILIDK